MKALSIRQPWAWLIMNAGKDIENRVWKTNVRGRILIHASKGMTRHEFDDAIAYAEMVSDCFDRIAPPIFEEIERGMIVGSVEIVACVVRAGRRNAAISPWFEGPFGFVLREPQPVKPFPFKGALGFFEVPEA